MQPKKLLIFVDRLLAKHEILANSISKYSNVKVVVELITDVTIQITGDKVEVRAGEHNISNFDLILFRRIGANLHLVGSLVVYLDKVGIKFVDEGLRSTAIGGNKLVSLMRLWSGGVNIIPMYYCTSDKIKGNFDNTINKIFGFPIIAKEINKHYLKGVYVLNNVSDLDKLESGRYIFQPFIKMIKEYRLLVLGGKVKTANVRTARSFEKTKVDYIDQDEKEVYLDISKISNEMKDVAVKSAEILNLQIAGVDICEEEGTGKLYVLEVNRGPAFNYDESYSPEVPETAKYLVSKLKT